MRQPRLLTAFATAGCAIVIVACGGTANKNVASQLSEHSIAPRVAPPVATVVTGREIAAAPSGSPQRAFLSMWSALQWQSWADAISNYQAGLITQIGQVKLVQALEFNAALYRTTKPKLEGETTNAGHVTIRYLISPPQTEPVRSSITWERQHGRWIIYYDPALDSALRSWAQVQTQQAIDPSAATPSARAVVAGIHASEAQGRYLTSQLTRTGR
jgi:hypothetical protein